MNQSLGINRTMLWAAVTGAIAMLAVTIFLRDLELTDGRAWAVSVPLVVGVACAILALKRGSLAKALVWAGSLAAVVLLVIYDVLDALIDPFFASDWPVAIASILLVCGLERILWSLLSDED